MYAKPGTLLDAFGDTAARMHPSLRVWLSRFRATPKRLYGFATAVVARFSPETITKIVSSLPAVEMRTHIIQALNSDHLGAVRNGEVRNLHRPVPSAGSGTLLRVGLTESGSAGFGRVAFEGGHYMPTSVTGRKRKRDNNAGVIEREERGGFYWITSGNRKVYLSPSGSTGSTVKAGRCNGMSGLETFASCFD